MVLFVKFSSFLFDIGMIKVVVKNPTLFLFVVIIDANKALISFSPLNSETSPLVIFKVSLKSKFRKVEVFYSLPKPMVIAKLELAFVLRLLR